LPDLVDLLEQLGLIGKHCLTVLIELQNKGLVPGLVLLRLQKINDVLEFPRSFLSNQIEHRLDLLLLQHLRVRLLRDLQVGMDQLVELSDDPRAVADHLD